MRNSGGIKGASPPRRRGGAGSSADEFPAKAGDGGAAMRRATPHHAAPRRCAALPTVIAHTVRWPGLALLCRAAPRPISIIRVASPHIQAPRRARAPPRCGATRARSVIDLAAGLAGLKLEGLVLPAFCEMQLMRPNIAAVPPWSKVTMRALLHSSGSERPCSVLHRT
jgi:hypothetical protein